MPQVSFHHLKIAIIKLLLYVYSYMDLQLILIKGLIVQVLDQA